MNLSNFKELLDMSESEWENRLEQVYSENFRSEACTMLVEQLAEECGVDQEIVEAILDNKAIDYE